VEEEIAAGSGGRVSHLEAGTVDEVWRIIFPLGVGSSLEDGAIINVHYLKCLIYFLCTAREQSSKAHTSQTHRGFLQLLYSQRFRRF
jgi:hypothetical protein